MKRFKKIIAIVLCTASLFAMLCVPVGANYYNTGKSFQLLEGSPFNPIWYTYEIYKEDRYWYTMFHDKDLTPVAYHKAGTGDTSFSCHFSKSYSSQTAYSFSQTVGGTANAMVVNATVNKTNGLTQTRGVTFQSSATVNKTVSSKSKTGYYKYAVCHDILKYSVEKLRGNTYVSKSYPTLPTGIPYFALLYSSTATLSGFSKV